MNWNDFNGNWGDDEENVALIGENVRYLKLSGSSQKGSPISAAQIYFFGNEAENEDKNPKHDQNSKIWIIFGVSAAVVCEVLIVIIIVIEVKKKSNRFGYSAEPLISYEKYGN